MVKGTTRQVLVVRPQESDLFEQAIFLLREEALEQHGVTEQALLEEARRLAAAPPSARPHRHPHARTAASRLSCTPRWERHLWGWRGSPAC